MTTRIRFASIGDCCADIYNGRAVKLGGTAYNVAMAAQKSGAKAAVVSAIGADNFGKKFLSCFKEHSINTSCLRIISGKTSSIPIALDSLYRPVYGTWDLGVMKNFSLDKLTINFLKTQDIIRAVMFTPIKALFGQFCSIPKGPFLKVGDFAGTSADSVLVEDIEQYAPYLDIIIKSIDEQRQKSLEILSSLANKYDVLVLALLGREGSIVFMKGKEYRQKAKLVNTKNSTGAGDVYQAYFLVTYMETQSILGAMQKATEAAAEAISKQ